MKVELELWHILTALAGFSAVLVAMGKLFFAQFDRRMDQRFYSQEKASHDLHTEVREAISNMQKAEREMLQWRAELPNLYVRREDFIRNQTVIEAKLDKVSSQVQMIDLKVAQR